MATARGYWGLMPPSILSPFSLAGANLRRWRNRRASASREGYDEINLNVGCPSDRVQEGRFGACLMRSPPSSASAWPR